MRISMSRIVDILPCAMVDMSTICTTAISITRTKIMSMST
jgi:hypothetical protein